MNISILYIISICSLILVLFLGCFIGFSDTQDINNHSQYTQTKITAIELAERLIKKNNLLNINIVSLKSKITNYYSFHYNVIKLSPNVIYSSLLQSLAISAHCVKDAKQGQKRTGLYMLKKSLIYISKVFTLIFVPIVLIFAIINASSSSKIPAIIILATCIGYLLALIIQLILLATELKSIKSIINDVKTLDLLNSDELSIFDSFCKSICKINFYNHTKLSLNFFSLASPNTLFKQERFEN